MMTARSFGRRAHLMLKLAAVCGWLALAALSLVPGSERLHTNLSGNFEHLLAYALAGCVTRLAFRRTPSRWQLLVFSGAAAGFEICQIWIPGRSAGVDNWAASSMGALIGIVSARSMVHLFEKAGVRA